MCDVDDERVHPSEPSPATPDRTAPDLDVPDRLVEAISRLGRTAIELIAQIRALRDLLIESGIVDDAGFVAYLHRYTAAHDAEIREGVARILASGGGRGAQSPPFSIP
jgi:hypothetical protein